VLLRTTPEMLRFVVCRVCVCVCVCVCVKHAVYLSRSFEWKVDVQINSESEKARRRNWSEITYVFLFIPYFIPLSPKKISDRTMQVVCVYLMLVYSIILRCCINCGSSFLNLFNFCLTVNGMKAEPLQQDEIYEDSGRLHWFVL